MVNVSAEGLLYQMEERSWLMICAFAVRIEQLYDQPNSTHLTTQTVLDHPQYYRNTISYILKRCTGLPPRPRPPKGAEPQLPAIPIHVLGGIIRI